MKTSSRLDVVRLLAFSVLPLIVLLRTGWTARWV